MYSKETQNKMRKARAAARKRLAIAHPEEYARYVQSEYDRAGIKVRAQRPRGASAQAQRKELAAARKEARRLKRIAALKAELESLQS